MGLDNEAEAGILRWMNSIRIQIAMDPARQFFENQVHEHGFQFLDDYWECILDGPQDEPIVELLKTPGRRRKSPTKSRIVGTTPSANFRDHAQLSFKHHDDDKENVAPVNNFHKALLQAKKDGQLQENTFDSLYRSNDSIFKDGAMRPREHISTDDDDRIRVNDGNESMVMAEDEFVPPRSEQNLSVIAEDVEMERSRNSIHSSRMSLDSDHQMPANRPTSAIPQLPVTGSTATVISTEDTYHSATDPSLADTLHSIPLNSPHKRSNSQSSHSQHLEQLDKSDRKKDVSHSSAVPPAEETTTFDRASGPYSPCTATEDTEAFTAPLAPYPAPQAYIPTSPKPPIRTHKPSSNQFPTLPAPMPFRKSLRAPVDPSAVAYGVSGSLQASTAGSKRTSWLAKAREAKALDESVLKGNGHGGTIQGGRTPGLKRKSAEMAESTVTSGNERKSKVAKAAETQTAFDFERTIQRSKLDIKASGAVSSVGRDPSPQQTQERSPDASAELPLVLPPRQTSPSITPLSANTEDMTIDGFKRMVQGLGARSGKSMGKSLGGAAAAHALAKARAAAEAKVAERDGWSPKDAGPSGQSERVKDVSVRSSATSSTRLSVSDLVTSFEFTKSKEKDAEPAFSQKASHPTFAAGPQQPEIRSTSPTESPPLPPAPSTTGRVFRPIPRVILPPNQNARSQAREAGADLALTTAFSKPSPINIGIPARLPSPSEPRGPLALTANPSHDSVASGMMFDGVDVPAWMPRTQDTEYSVVPTQPIDDDDEDSWPLADRIAARNEWFGIKELDGNVSVTWSSSTDSKENTPMVGRVPGAFETELAVAVDHGDDDDAHVTDDEELQQIMKAGKATVGLVQSKANREAGTQSQLSMASSGSSSQSTLGILGQASKFVTSVLGGVKKNKPEVKSLQLAAAAAKKQQEERDKKAARLKEMENRRQLASQRKAEEEKVRAAEEERKIREDGERRKRENTERRPLRSALKKGTDEDNTQKRKLAAEADKKTDMKKPPPGKVPTKIMKPGANTSTHTVKFNPAKSALKHSSVLDSSTAYNISQTTVKGANSSEAKGPKAAGAVSVPTKGTPNVQDEDISQPAQLVQSKMAARAKAQMQSVGSSVAPTDHIELPDINSEYSDSEDEERPRAFDPPDWAQSPELRQALEQQSTVNPDDIFGEIRPLRMEEIFRNRQSRFRARTSSANWAGADRLTVDEEREYARRMGFR